MQTPGSRVQPSLLSGGAEVGAQVTAATQVGRLLIASRSPAGPCLFSQTVLRARMGWRLPRVSEGAVAVVAAADARGAWWRWLLQWVLLRATRLTRLRLHIGLATLGVAPPRCCCCCAIVLMRPWRAVSCPRQRGRLLVLYVLGSVECAAGDIIIVTQDYTAD
jgi:hypothetical protein